jgi:hypothetical protein
MTKPVPDIWIKVSTDGVEIFTDIDVHIHLLDTTYEGSPQVLSKLDAQPITALMNENEIFLDDYRTIAIHKNLEIQSTFHDYTLNLLDKAGEIITSRGMGDGVDNCEWNSGTLGHQFYLQSLLKNNYSEMMEAYFPDHQKVQ